MDWDRSLEIIKKCMIMKQNMQKKGIKAAKAKCPYCEGFWHGRLMGRKDHLHMMCDGYCGSQMME